MQGYDFSLSVDDLSRYPEFREVQERALLAHPDQTFGQIVRHCIEEKLGWDFWGDGRDYDLFVFGVRNDVNELQRDANTFNDIIGASYCVDGRRYWELYPATVDPGIPIRRKPYQSVGKTGIVREGQWRRVYKAGYHGDERALCEQSSHPFQVYRDGDLNDYLNLDPASQEAGYGFQMHDAGRMSTVVNQWSGGCQVHAIERTMYRMMELVDRQAAQGLGDAVSYSLIRASWLWRDTMDVRQEYTRIQDI